jgi:hypothetical protein
MLWWEEGFCRMLADGGRFVIRYDHRDGSYSESGWCNGVRIRHPNISPQESEPGNSNREEPRKGEAAASNPGSPRLLALLYRASLPRPRGIPRGPNFGSRHGGQHTRPRPFYLPVLTLAALGQLRSGKARCER